MGGREEPFDGFLIRGKFTDNSTEADWKCTIDAKVISLVQFVNPATKEFEYRQDSKPKSLNKMFASNTGIERIDVMQGIEKVSDLWQAFNNSTSLVSLNMSQRETMIMTPTGFHSVIAGAQKLRYLALNVDLSNVSEYFRWFFYNNALTDLKGKMSNIKVSVDASQTALSAESAQVLIDGLSTEVSGKSISFASVTRNALSEEQKQMILDKGWQSNF